MPVYECECAACGILGEYLRSADECYDTPVCSGCGQKTQKVILTPPKGYVVGNFDTFQSVVDGSLISGEQSLREHNKRNNVVSLAEGYSDEAVKSGKFGNTPSPDKSLKADMVEAYKKVKEGYVPRREVLSE